jgi:uncharacterized damage-inducible protein DinB
MIAHYFYRKMKNLFLILITLLTMEQLTAQSELPYAQIPDYPDTYTPGTVASRMVDGLGYRYYWASDSLMSSDLKYKPSDDSRTIDETLDHIYGLSLMVLNAALNEPNVFAERDKMTFEEKRRATLENIQKASQLLLENNDLSQNKVIFQGANGSNEFPFWNMINGPIADAIYHTGQVVAFRRAAGNPINPKVSVLRGKNRD